MSNRAHRRRRPRRNRDDGDLMWCAACGRYFAPLDHVHVIAHAHDHDHVVCCGCAVVLEAEGFGA
jgi:hypothetical protein